MRLVPEAGYELFALPLSGLKGAGWPARIRAAAHAGFGLLRIVAWMARRRPDLVIGVGGYASGPAVLAAWILRVPTMILEQNHFPGATNLWLAPRVDLVCVPSDAARRRMRGRILVTGNPVRAEFARIVAPGPSEPMGLLVFGGSRGARSLNRAMISALTTLARLDPAPKITHQTGAEDHAAILAAYTENYPRESFEVRAYFDDMPARFAEADLIVSRAGATTLAELCVAGRPAILVPYPHAADDHQRHNAESLRDSGAAIVLTDAEIADGSRLANAVAALAIDPALRSRMAAAAHRLGRPDAAARISAAAESLLAGRDPLDEMRDVS